MKAAKNLALSVALLLFQGSAYIPPLLVSSAIFSLSAQPAYANVQTFRVVQTFGYDSSAGGYKIMVRSEATNRRFFIWYPTAIGVNQGNTVLIEVYNGTLVTVNNPSSGSSSRIFRVAAVD